MADNPFAKFAPTEEENQFAKFAFQKSAEASAEPQGKVKIGADAFPDTLRSVLKDAGWATRNYAAAGTALSNLWEGTKQFAGQEDKGQIAANRIIREEAPIGALAGEAGLTAIPFAKAGRSLPAVGAVGAGYGVMQPVNNADNWIDVLRGKTLNTAIGAGSSVAGQAVANKALSGVSSKLSSIEQKVQDKATQVAASETASARGSAGAAAANAYRQLEHLRELGANRALTAEEQLTVMTLERELSEKTVDNLLPAAALKQSTSDAYKEAMATEADRAAQYAAEKLSNAEIKQQIMARLKRYGPAAAGGVVGNLLLPGLGGAVGGAATGLVLRPAIRSMFNLSKNPAVQHGVLSQMQNSAALNYPALPISALLASEGLLGQ